MDLVTGKSLEVPQVGMRVGSRFQGVEEKVEDAEIETWAHDHILENLGSDRRGAGLEVAKASGEVGLKGTF